ncbi:MAG: SPOR domain-containing protein [Desulfovibrionaceae bacterium]|nr:SPOR domain-containing protein [Desulfovibrionaceae bacterium]
MDTKPTPEEKKDEGGSVVTLKPSSLLAISIVILCAVALAYVGGVMSGRASAEKDYYSEIAAHREIEQQRKDEENKEKPGILPTEELEFSRVLRNNNLPAKSLEPIAPQVPKQTAATPPPQSQEKQKPDSEVPLLTNPDTGIYDYVYQVAAVKGEDNADAMRQRLEGRGLRTYMKRGKNLLHIQVKLRGDSSKSKELLKILESMHLGRPFLVSKKPAR